MNDHLHPLFKGIVNAAVTSVRPKQVYDGPRGDAGMNVTTTWHGDQFNIDLSNKGKEAFLSIKGCRIVDGKDGPFVSYPAKKNESTGKWWQHAWGSSEFNAVVLEKALASKPQQQARAGSQRVVADDDSIPF